MFLVNVRCHICFSLVSLLGFAACAALGRRFRFFRRLKESYIFAGLISSFQACYIDIVLCAFVQLRYFGFSYTGFYSLNCFAAVAALLVEILYLCFSAHVFARPVSLLLSPECKGRYGALYEDIKTTSASGMPMMLIHNLRLFVLIPLLVLSADRPVFQSSVYGVSAAMSLAWDAALRPYEGTLLSAQVFFMDIAKLAAAAGYIVLSVPTISPGQAGTVCEYEIIVLLVAMCGGLVLVLVQQAAAIWGQIREICRRRREMKYGITVSNVDSSQATGSGVGGRLPEGTA